MNSLTSVERQCRSLMTAHGVGSLDFRFTRGTTTIAQMGWVRIGDTRLAKYIGLSKRWGLVLPESDLWQIMIHEIAHAKVVHKETRPHGREFQRAVRAMGANSTNRCYRPTVYIDGRPRPVIQSGIAATTGA